MGDFDADDYLSQMTRGSGTAPGNKNNNPAPAPAPAPPRGPPEASGEDEAFQPRFEEGTASGASSRIEMMRAEAESDKELEGIVGDYDNDDYIHSLRRPREELWQTWEKPKRRLWHNEDWSADMMNGKTREEMEELMVEKRKNYVPVDAEDMKVMRVGVPSELEIDMEEAKERILAGGARKQLTYAEQMAQAKAAKAGGGTAAVAAVAAAPAAAPAASARSRTREPRGPTPATPPAPPSTGGGGGGGEGVSGYAEQLAKALAKKK